jgi:uncharacterized Ntn-hydrolase superfamily protein
VTWSIVARDPESGRFGIAAASFFFALGALVPHASRDGAIATQALINPTSGPRGLRLLAEGLPAERVRDLLAELDAGREARQLHLVDREGRGAAWTGAACVPCCGHRVEEGVSVAGNMLAGPDVLDATLDSWRRSAVKPFVERLLAAMDAGEAAGGDSRGRQSAVLRIQGGESFPRLDLRVDDHAAPLVELRRLYGVAKERFLAFSTAFPEAELDAGIIDRAVIERRIAELAGTTAGRV